MFELGNASTYRNWTQGTGNISEYEAVRSTFKYLLLQSSSFVHLSSLLYNLALL